MKYSNIDVIAWSNMLGQLADARMHLGELILHMAREGSIDDDELCIQLGHIYGHLNRCWNGRKLTGNSVELSWTDEFSSFPKDIQIT